MLALTILLLVKNRWLAGHSLKFNVFSMFNFG